MPVFVVDKPLGVTSHDVVASVRRELRTKRVGHAGTLDPLATGVLTVLVGDATKLSPFLVGADKTYLAWIAFGASTATWDAEGPIVDEGDASHLEAATIEDAAEPFLSVTEQRPPAFSAIKRSGRPAYATARKGQETPQMDTRPAGYRRVDLLAFGDAASLPSRFAPTPTGPDRGAWAPSTDGRSFTLPPPLTHGPVALVSLTVAAGTYVRAFAHDLGLALGVPAHLAGLVRTAAGTSNLATACRLGVLESCTPTADVDAVPFPTIAVDGPTAVRLRQGQRLSRDAVEGEGRVAFVDGDRRLVAIADVDADRMHLLRTFPAPRAN